MKTYVKPDLYYENFELSTHVASCALDMPHSKNVNECYVTGEDIGMPEEYHFFSAGPEVCTYGEYEEYCYTNGSEGYNIFNS